MRTRQRPSHCDQYFIDIQDHSFYTPATKKAVPINSIYVKATQAYMKPYVEEQMRKPGYQEDCYKNVLKLKKKD
jgi:hypothetical protein